MNINNEIRIITFGTFDLFHEGHFNILKRAASFGNYLIVGVSSDELTIKKSKTPVWNLEKRIETLKQFKQIDEIFIEESLELKKQYVEKYKADIFIIGDDWKGEFDWIGIPCIYLPRTKDISTTVS